MPCTSSSDALYYWYSRLVPLVLSISIPPKPLLLRPLHGIPYTHRRHILLSFKASLSPKIGGRKVKVKIPLPPSETPLFKGDSIDLVEVEVNFVFMRLSTILLKIFLIDNHIVNNTNESFLFAHQGDGLGCIGLNH